MTARRGFLALAAVVVLAARPARAAYDMFNTAVAGSAREVGLAGTDVALPMDYTSVFVNPAGMSGMADTGVDFGSDSNGVDNYVVDTANPKSRQLGDPLKYSYYGFRFVTDNGWGFGAASQQPFLLDNTFQGTALRFKNTRPIPGVDNNEIKVQDSVYTLAVGRAFFDKTLGIGLGVNYIQGSERYNFQSISVATASVQTQALTDTFSADLGLLYRPRPWLQVGAVFKMGYNLPFNVSENTLLPNGLFAYQPAKVPDRFEFGVAWMPTHAFSFFVQSNLVMPMKNAAVFGSGLFPGTSTVVGAGQTYTMDAHWAMEITPIDVSDLTIKLWAGGYLENAGIIGGFNRYHNTAGFHFEPWFVSLNAAIDKAYLYNNFTVGVGVDLLPLVSRIAKYYGWNLPL